MYTTQELDGSVYGSVGVKTGFFAENDLRDVKRAEVQLLEIILYSRSFIEVSNRQVKLLSY
jgi:hypothetical protein